MCVCVCVCDVCVRPQVHLPLCTWKLKAEASIFLNHAPPYVLQQGLSLCLKFIISAGLAGQLTPQDSPALVYRPVPSSYTQAEASNSGPQAPTAGALPMEPLLQQLEVLVFSPRRFTRD